MEDFGAVMPVGVFGPGGGVVRRTRIEGAAGSISTGGQNELAALDAPRAEQPVGQGLNFAGRPLNEQDFQALVAVQVDMGRGDDLGVLLMLQVKQILREFPLVVVVHHDHNADNGGIPLEFLLEYVRAHQVRHCLGAVGVALLANQLVKLCEQIDIARNAEAGDFLHSLTIRTY